MSRREEEVILSEGEEGEYLSEGSEEEEEETSAEEEDTSGQESGEELFGALELPEFSGEESEEETGETEEENEEEIKIAPSTRRVPILNSETPPRTMPRSSVAGTPSPSRGSSGLPPRTIPKLSGLEPSVTKTPPRTMPRPSVVGTPSPSRGPSDLPPRTAPSPTTGPPTRNVLPPLPASIRSPIPKAESPRKSKVIINGPEDLVVDLMSRLKLGEDSATIMAEMIISKAKYGTGYSMDQERMIGNAIKDLVSN